MIIDKEFQSLMPLLQKEEREKLEENIKKEGVRESLIIWNDILIDGYNRKEIADKLKIKYKIKRIKLKDRPEAILWIINNQLGRRNLSSYDRTRLALKYKEILKSIAERNQKNPFKNYNKFSTGNEGVSHIYDKGRVDEKIGEIAKVSRNIVRKVEFIEQYANKDQKQRLSTQQDSINKVYHEIKKEITKEIKVKNLPKEEFDIVYADPPWKYQFSETNERSIETHYPPMTLENIKKLNIKTSKNAILFLWATAPKLKEALEVLESWGYEYKTCAVWDKEMIGMGYWFRGQHELLLLGVKGKISPPESKNRFSSVIKSKRTLHSKKPIEVYEMIEKMFPNKKYLELFARENDRPYWTCWGLEYEDNKR